CAEYGLHESFPMYSGGLGVLAGDHCKTASDLRLPFTGVGLLYRAGYFHQRLDGEGNQLATYVESDIDNLPISAVKDAGGQQVQVSVEFPERTVHAAVWKARVGHVAVYLLDTDVEENSPEDRAIAYQLYGGDTETRIKKEMILGLGGVRALRSLGLSPTVWHINEGHSAFLILERIRELVSAGESFAAAMEAVAASTVFTTHTPVPAGHDHFPEDMVLRYLEALISQLGIKPKKLLELGRLPDAGPDFNMTALALRGSRHQNGVSQIHGAVSASICAKCWPQIPAEENPMGFITNGVHVPTFLDQAWADLYDRFLGADWRNHLSDFDYWQRIHDIPDHLFWSVSQSIKSQMLYAVRASITEQHLRNHVSEPHIERILRHIDPSDPNVLTIGFARRFATYKRATLLFQNLDWLRHLIDKDERPVVFIFAGKAHPADGPGQQLMRDIHEMSARPEFVGKVLLVEGYDLGLARRLVCGVDVWLNNPVYSMEASGTSGMKAAINGTINLSVTDGWWGEGFTGDNGWAIRPSPHRNDEARRDAEDARTLYEILQDGVIPLYYARGKHGYSPDWVALAKRSMATVLPRFNMKRALEEYISDFYIPAAQKGRQISADKKNGARELAKWKGRVEKAWAGVAIRNLDDPPHRMTFGDKLCMDVAVKLNGLAPEDLVVEFQIARPKETNEAAVGGGFTLDESPMQRFGAEETEVALVARFTPAGSVDGTDEQRYSLELKPEWCGRLSYRIRVYPFHRLLTHPLEAGRLVWL
ncbi:MAG: DUF3417 domain-containing protein, partial [Gammaproteobacteria bacterium]